MDGSDSDSRLDDEEEDLDVYNEVFDSDDYDHDEDDDTKMEVSA